MMTEESEEGVKSPREITIGDVYKYLSGIGNYSCFVCKSDKFKVSPSNLLMYFQSQTIEKKTPDMMPAVAIACGKCGNINIFDSFIIMQNIIGDIQNGPANGKSE